MDLDNTILQWKQTRHLFVHNKQLRNCFTPDAWILSVTKVYLYTTNTFFMFHFIYLKFNHIYPLSVLCSHPNQFSLISCPFIATQNNSYPHISFTLTFSHSYLSNPFISHPNMKISSRERKEKIKY